ncbi:MAG: DNA-directed RNA polymerase subunit omega [Sulfobacillus sp.]
MKPSLQRMSDAEDDYDEFDEGGSNSLSEPDIETDAATVPDSLASQIGGDDPDHELEGEMQQSEEIEQSEEEQEESEEDTEEEEEIEAGFLQPNTELVEISAMKEMTSYKTLDFLTSFERARIVGTRAQQIAGGAVPLVPIEGLRDPISIAERELSERKLPMMLRRPLPEFNGKRRAEIRQLAALY